MAMCSTSLKHARQACRPSHLAKTTHKAISAQVQSTCERGHMHHCACVSKHLAGEASHAIAWPMHGLILS